MCDVCFVGRETAPLICRKSGTICNDMVYCSCMSENNNFLFCGIVKRRFLEMKSVNRVNTGYGTKLI